MGRPFIKNFFLVLGIALVLSSCGDSENKPAPTPTDPRYPNGGSFPSGNTDQDPRLTYFAKAVELVLSSGNPNYTGIKEILLSSGDTLLTPVIDTIIQMTINNGNSGRSSTPTGDVRIGLEDNAGFWGAILPSFPGATYQSDTLLDMIFSDSLLTIRVQANRNSDDLGGYVSYRIRQSGQTQCQKPSYCDMYGSSGWPYGGWSPPECDPNYMASVCQSYMNTSNSQVKPLGTFNAKYSSWVE